jgi:hypothetical protein
VTWLTFFIAYSLAQTFVPLEICQRTQDGTGFQKPTKGLNLADFTLWVNPNLVTTIVEEKSGNHIICSIVSVSGHRVLVIGSSEEVARKLGKQNDE